MDNKLLDLISYGDAADRLTENGRRYLDFYWKEVIGIYEAEYRLRVRRQAQEDRLVYLMNALGLGEETNGTD